MQISDFKVTLLGTGTPNPTADRFGPSTLVEAGTQKLVIDAGRGVPIRLWQLKVPVGQIDALLLTHFHSDHTAGIPDLWLTGWIQTPWGGRTTPFRVIGPMGTKSLMSNLESAYALDIKIRIADEENPPLGVAVVAEEFTKDGVVYAKDGVRVIAFEVDHGDLIKPAYGYRVEYRAKSVVISGDTRFDENVVKYGIGADVLIHEVSIAKPEARNAPIVQSILAHHTSPRECGIVFDRAKPTLAVYTHISRPFTATVPAASINELIAQTRETYVGPLEVGEDLMAFEIGDAVIVHRPSR